MQDRQSVILRQQQSQAEQLMRELQSRMEADMRMRSELLRNQLRMFMEIEAMLQMSVIGLLRDAIIVHDSRFKIRMRS